jgi:Mn-dependent DtxR family transcriptional regulator
MSELVSSMSRRVLRALRELTSEELQCVTNAFLAERLQISPFTVSRTLGELERAGYITFSWQSPDPARQRWSGRTIQLQDRTN